MLKSVFYSFLSFCLVCSAESLPWTEKVQIITDKIYPDSVEALLGVTYNGVWSWDDDSGSDSVIPDQPAVNGKVHNFSIVFTCVTTSQLEDAEEDGVDLTTGITEDIYENQTTADWWHWEEDPVYMVSPNFTPFLDFLFKKAVQAIDQGVNSIYIDELNMLPFFYGTEENNAGFGRYDVKAFEDKLKQDGYSSFKDYLSRSYFDGWWYDSSEICGAFDIDSPDKFSVQAFLAAENDSDIAKIQKHVFAVYRDFQVDNHYRICCGFIRRIRDYAESKNKDVKVSGNVVALGGNLGTYPVAPENTLAYVRLLDYVAFENQYLIPGVSPDYVYPPRGKLGAFYRLGKSLIPGFTAIVPGFGSSACFEDKTLCSFTELMFCEAFACGGNWILGRFPENDQIYSRISVYTDFVKKNHQIYEGQKKPEKTAVLYIDSCVQKDALRYYSFLGTSQALFESGIEHDVFYAGSERFGQGDILPDLNASLEVLILPMCNSVPEKLRIALSKFPGLILAIGPGAESLSGKNLKVLPDNGLLYMKSYSPEQKKQIADAVLKSHVPLIKSISSEYVHTVCCRKDGSLFVHLLNYNYHASDEITPCRNLKLTFSDGSSNQLEKAYFPGMENSASQVTVTGNAVTVPLLHTYCVLEFKE